MWRMRKGVAILGVGLWAGASAIGQPVLEPAVESPQVRDTAPGDHRHIGPPVFPGPFSPYGGYDSATFSLVFPPCSGVDCDVEQAHSSLSLPAGAVIDSIGVNTATTLDVPMSFSVYSRDSAGDTTNLGTFSIPTHAGFATDYFDFSGLLIPGNAGRALVVIVRSPPNGSDVASQYLGFVEVRWRRTVSDPPAAATFGDVPSSHPFFQFIEALGSSGITGGCGGGNYCPDSPLTRGQMAVFLSKALGLHWPY